MQHLYYLWFSFCLEDSLRCWHGITISTTCSTVYYTTSSLRVTLWVQVIQPVHSKKHWFAHEWKQRFIIWTLNTTLQDSTDEQRVSGVMLKLMYHLIEMKILVRVDAIIWNPLNHEMILQQRYHCPQWTWQTYFFFHVYVIWRMKALTDAGNHTRSVDLSLCYSLSLSQIHKLWLVFVTLKVGYALGVSSQYISYSALCGERILWALNWQQLFLSCLIHEWILCTLSSEHFQPTISKLLFRSKQRKCI